MLPSLQDEDRLFIRTWAHESKGSSAESIHRGDVVIFDYPFDRSKKYIKRVIGLPGDILRIDHGVVWINGKVLPEPYIPPRYQDDRSQPELSLGTDEYFCMGDNRSISRDSRDIGPIPRELIDGRAAFVIWPMDQLGIVH